VVVWDLPIRVFHWALVSLTLLSWWLAESGELAWHRRSGLAILGLLVFRLYWGFAGSSTARFRDFVIGPRRVLAYARRLHLRQSSYRVGHNPLSGLGALSILTLVGVQVALGLIAVDVDGLESGPLSHWVSFELGRSAANAHELTFSLLGVLLGVHVAAVGFYALFKRDNLLGAMLVGDRTMPVPRAPAEIAPAWRVIPGVVLALSVVTLIAWVLGSA